MTNRMWSVLLAVAAILGAQSVGAQEEEPKQVTLPRGFLAVAELRFAHQEALDDFQAWIRDEAGVRSVLEKEGFDFGGGTQTWYAEEVAPASAYKTGDWYTLRFDSGPLTPDAAKERWAAIREAYAEHLEEKIRAMTKEATAELQAQVIAIGDQHDECLAQKMKMEEDYSPESLKAAVEKARDTQVQIELELAGLTARLSAIRDSLEREEEAMEQAAKDRLPLLDLQRQAVQRRVEYAESQVAESKAAIESGRSAESQLYLAEGWLLSAQTEFIELETKGNDVEVTPVHTRLREMLVEAEIAHAELAARKKIADDHFSLVAERLERYKGLVAEMNRTMGESGTVMRSMSVVANEVREKVLSAYDFGS